MKCSLYLLAIVLALATLVVYAQPILNEGEVCGRQCKKCALMKETCKEDLMCVYNPTGCARGYQGVCMKKCSKHGRNKEECEAQGPHCVFYGRTQPRCYVADAGCRLDIAKYKYNPKQTCRSLPCAKACARFPDSCRWNAKTSTCQGLFNIANERTPKCWNNCAKFPAPNPNEVCSECTMSLIEEYEYETPANSYCWNFLEDRPTNKFCLNNFNRKATCDANEKCKWTYARPPSTNSCYVDSGCHASNWCGFICKKNCLNYPDRCNWIEGTGCRQKAITYAPTNFSTR